MSRKQRSPKRAAAAAARVARQKRSAWRRDRIRGLSAAERIDRQFNNAGTPRQSGTERSPV